MLYNNSVSEHFETSRNAMRAGMMRAHERHDIEKADREVMNKGENNNEQKTGSINDSGWLWS